MSLITTGAFAGATRVPIVSTDVVGARVPRHRAAIAAASVPA